MNSLCKDLLFKAGFTGSDLSNTQPGTCHETAFENLFQLVVSECARVARNADLEDVDGGDSAVLRAAGEQIESHFGVK